MDVLIHIKGTQTVDGEKDEVELTTAGTLEKLADGWKLSYEETEATGMQGTATQLQIRPNRVEMEHVGTHNSMLVLEKHRRHHCNYTTPYGTLDLGTYTTDLDYQLSNQGGCLRVCYTLSLNGSVNSNHTIDITVQEEQNYV